MRPSALARYMFAAYAALIVYASLHPFTGWRDHGIVALAFLFARLPRYLTTFDIVANIVAYAPFGFLAVLALYPAVRGVAAVLAAVLGAAALSLALETLQNFLPSRIPSNVDLAANGAGALAGALAGAMLTTRLLRDAGLQALRYRMFRAGGTVDLGMVLIGLWLVSHLNPGTLLFGAGDLRELLRGSSGTLHAPDVFIRVEAGIVAANTVSVGLLAAALLERGQPVRLLALALLGTALLVRTLAYGVLFSPQEAFAWFTPGAMFGLPAGAVACLAALGLPRSARLALSALGLMAATALVNLAPPNPYLAASLALWPQGHFLNFNGLTRVVSVLWPFAALLYVVILAGRRAERARP